MASRACIKKLRFYISHAWRRDGRIPSSCFVLRSGFSLEHVFYNFVALSDVHRPAWWRRVWRLFTSLSHYVAITRRKYVLFLQFPLLLHHILCLETHKKYFKKL
jgi:hypothetical protein